MECLVEQRRNPWETHRFFLPLTFGAGSNGHTLLWLLTEDTGRCLDKIPIIIPGASWVDSNGGDQVIPLSLTKPGYSCLTPALQYCQQCENKTETRGRQGTVFMYFSQIEVEPTLALFALRSWQPTPRESLPFPSSFSLLKLWLESDISCAFEPLCTRCLPDTRWSG